MNSKIKVEHEFGTGQTWLQMYVSTATSDGGQPDLRDSALKNFIEKAIDPNNQLYISYPENNQDNSVVKIEVGPKTIPLQWVGLNAKCLKEVNDNFKVGKSYNLLMATGQDHRVYAKGSGHIVRYKDEMEFAYLAEFVQAWEVNDIGRFEVNGN